MPLKQLKRQQRLERERLSLLRTPLQALTLFLHASLDDALWLAGLLYAYSRFYSFMGMSA